ncbi:MAG TPA: ribosome recycling factor [Candidatus Caccosoma faecigallinarum]|jgi:ribosome recycling factor|uniref:Ribosome-recycling factor n=1 Tax=Candidatus Caccosoma faecigallinarum TaxID=2840720 RepID=A0A9D1G863_9FIRM|nr:ribosome-recycling factor [Firmicutes bacterium CAG:631]HIT17327.1 ribosome recycling factor [Candidatus Caccosoma faecigallinarum]
MSQEVKNEAKERMEKSIASFKEELTTVRTGRANTSLVNNVEIDYYGTPTPIYQVAQVSVVDARQITIRPYDKSELKKIETAIINADLNLTPLNDGTMIRVNVPALTEERRKQYVKDVYALAENAKVAIRNIRRDANASLKKLEKETPEDLLRHYNEEIQKLTDEYVKKIDELAKAKEKELLTV